MSCRCEQVSRASKQHDTLPALSRGERGEGTPRERLIVPPHGDRTVAAGEPPPLATPSGHASPDRPPNRDVPKNCAGKSSSWLLSPASPRSSPWTTSGKLPRTATWTRRRSSSRRTRSWSTNPTPPGTYALRPRSRERSPIAPPMHPSIIFFRFIPNRRSSPPIPDPNTPAYAHISTAGTPGPSLHLASRTRTHPRAQVPAPAVGGAQQPSRGCNLPHRTRRRGERD